MDIGNITSQYADYLSSSSDAASKISAISGQKNTTKTDAQLMSSCKEFEEYMVEMVMKEVSKSVNVFGDSGDTSSDMSLMQDNAKDQMIKDLATKITDSGNLGIAQKLFESMKRTTT